MEKLDFLPKSQLHYEKSYLKELNPLTLSFIGDGVHTLFVRTMVMDKAPYKNNALHVLTSEQVCAVKQAATAKMLSEHFTEEEDFIFRKAKNAKTNSLPKNASLMEYHLATGLEAVIGYLYLSGENERLTELFKIIYEN